MQSGHIQVTDAAAGLGRKEVFSNQLDCHQLWIAIKKIRILRLDWWRLDDILKQAAKYVLAKILIRYCWVVLSAITKKMACTMINRKCKWVPIVWSVLC